MASPFVLIGLLGILTLSGGAASAQTAPTPMELAAYRGLHAAAAQGSVDDIRQLAQAGSDLNARDSNGRTPLHVAAFKGHGAAAQALIAAGADSSLLDNQRYDAVTIAAVMDDVSTLKALLTAGASAKLVTSVYDGTALIAAVRDDVEILLALVEPGASASLTTSPYDGTALIAAAHLGYDGVVRELIGAGAPLDHVNNLGWTALIEAVILGNGGLRHTETVRALVEAGADPTISDRAGVTPLQHAQARGYSSIVSILHQIGRR